jgi:hypothetical protein
MNQLSSGHQENAWEMWKKAYRGAGSPEVYTASGADESEVRWVVDFDPLVERLIKTNPR